MNFSSTADHQIKANVRNEAPEYSLGNREGQGDEDYSQKTRQALFNFPKINLVDTLEHRCADQHQHRRSRIERHHRGERRQKEARQKAKRGEDRKSTRLNSSHTVISYAVFCLKK